MATCDDLDVAVRAMAFGEALPAGYDLPAAIESVVEAGDLALLGRITARYLLQRNLAELHARRAVILSGIKLPPLH